MKRLTKFIEEIRHYEFVCVDEKGLSYCPFAWADKLGQLEDIEEELGIDLITYIKLEKLFFDNRLVIYTKNMTDEDDGIRIAEFNYGEKCLSYGSKNYYFADYGKTWALDKQTLEKEELEK